MTAALSTLIWLSAAATIQARYAGALRRGYLCKPLTTALILLVALWPPWAQPARYAFAILAGLAFSLVGDVLLMLPRERFVLGLAVFVLAHVCYIFAFSVGAPWRLDLVALTVGLLVVALTYLLVGRRADAMRWPVLAYALVIVTMAYAAWSRWAALGGQRALLAFLGACLFVVSDVALAVNRFAHPFRAVHLLVLGAYYAGQWLIALSV
jgi:uncharacterized membrane protein YhhN